MSSAQSTISAPVSSTSFLEPSKLLFIDFDSHFNKLKLTKFETKSHLTARLLPAFCWPDLNYYERVKLESQDEFPKVTEKVGTLLAWQPRLSEKAWFMGTMGAGAFRVDPSDRFPFAPNVPPLGRDTDSEPSHSIIFMRVNDSVMCAAFFNKRRDVFPDDTSNEIFDQFFSINRPNRFKEIPRYRKRWSQGIRSHLKKRSNQ